MKINHYLEELGIKWEDLPGNYSEDYEEDCAAADPRNIEDDEGFCTYEFFSLDYSLALYIYPRLCYFREHIAEIGTPSCFCYLENGEHNDNGNEEWKAVIDYMVLAFKYVLRPPEELENEIIQEVISTGLHLFAEYYSCLWY